MSPSDDRSPEEIEAEIEETRSDLGETVADIADKADVKKQAGKKAAEAREKVKETVSGKDDGVEPGGSGGDIGSGPTGDVRNSPEIVEDSRHQVLIAVAGGLVAGLVLGRLIWS